MYGVNVWGQSTQIHIQPQVPELVNRLDSRSQTERRMPYDSSTAKIVNRLHEHELRTIPVIEKYRKEREVTDIDGTGTP
jgi:adenylate kinase